MAYELVIGERMYSSWSLRAWLIFEQFGLPVSTKVAPMQTPEFHEILADFAPARLVPTMRSAGRVVWDTLAIAETLAEAHPGLWPEDAADRALARSLVAEMHSGFPALRSTCAMNLRTRFETPPLSDAGEIILHRIAERRCLEP
ncbi:MAG: glutathione S-transferase, partial [Pseudomonadota bacterium]